MPLKDQFITIFEALAELGEDMGILSTKSNVDDGGRIYKNITIKRPSKELTPTFYDLILGKNQEKKI